MTVEIPPYEHAVLYYEAMPAAYEPGPRVGKGFIYTPEGLGELDFGVTGILSHPEHPTCTTPEGVGILDEWAGRQKELTTQELSTKYIRTGELLTENLTIIRGMDPLRTLFISDGFGADLPGGQTIYGIEVNTTNRDVVYVGVASRLNFKDEFIFRKWTKIKYPAVLARPIVSGREFKILVYTKGGGDFVIKSIRVWMKLTDRRGFNTSPQGASQAQGDQS